MNCRGRAHRKDHGSIEQVSPSEQVWVVGFFRGNRHVVHAKGRTRASTRTTLDSRNPLETAMTRRNFLQGLLAAAATPTLFKVAKLLPAAPIAPVVEPAADTLLVGEIAKIDGIPVYVSPYLSGMRLVTNSYRDDMKKMFPPSAGFSI